MKRTSILSVVLIALAAAPGPVPSFSMVFQAEPFQAGSEEERRGVQETNSGEDLLLRKDTEVKLVFAQSLSSKHATIDEKIELRVAEDVLADGRVAIPKGARVIGTVTTGKKNEKYGNSKTLGVRIDYIALKDRRILLTGVKEQKPKTNIGAVATATVGLGVSGLMIYMNQRESWIHEGTEVAGYVAEDVLIRN